ncbi:MAG: DNA methyltransferase [Armatimonadetes bacterium RBG_16_58_9]|nr:MAG: DNA methyltransferase [Armatimonadetes bacterium RBG_16_58_9]
MFADMPTRLVAPFKTQLLKWIGNKQRFAYEMASYFPEDFGIYYEPFLGSGAVLGTLGPKKAIGSDNFQPLMEIWQILHDSPETLKQWYSERWHIMMSGDKVEGYERVKASYNADPNGADLLFLCRSCYGGVVRFRQADGYMSTPCGVHKPISPNAFSQRVDLWRERTGGTEFICADYEQVMDRAESGDMVYCDPPYNHSQGILYGAQSFDLAHLCEVIRRCKARGVYVALSIDGMKRSGATICELPIPHRLFERELFVNCGRSMLRRFQMGGQSLEDEVVSDRLLLTY